MQKFACLSHSKFLQCLVHEIFLPGDFALLMSSQTLMELKVNGKVSIISASVVKHVPALLKKGTGLKMAPQHLSSGFKVDDEW